MKIERAAKSLTRKIESFGGKVDSVWYSGGGHLRLRTVFPKGSHIFTHKLSKGEDPRASKNWQAELRRTARKLGGING